MADIESDLEDMLEAPYNKITQSQNEDSQPVETQARNGLEQSDEPKSAERKKSRKERSRSRSRDRHRKRSRSRSRSKRSKRSRSKERRRRSRERRRSRTRSRSRRSKSRSKRRSRSKDERRRRSRDRKRSPTKEIEVVKEKSPELTPEERDQRTVFCMQLAARIRPRDLEDFFSTVGRVRDVRLITDPRTKRSKGIAYIEFRDIESVPLAIALTGQRLLGVPIIVKLTQAEKNRMPFTGPHIPANLPQTGPIKLYVGSLHPNISEEMLQAIFEPFGLIDAILLARDDFGRSKGYGFIQFASAEDGKKAMEQLNNFELVQKPIKVSLYVEANDKSLYPGMVNPMITNLDNDELDRTGVNLGPSGKLALMAKLAEGTDLQVPKQTMDALSMGGGVQQMPNAATPGAPVATQCFLLSNMFDLLEEIKKPEWVEDIRDDVITECSKYGGIVHIHVDTESPEGNIYIKCPTVAVATSAMAALNGRFFAGKVIKASYIPISAYHMRFAEAADCTELLEPSQ